MRQFVFTLEPLDQALFRRDVSGLAVYRTLFSQLETADPQAAASLRQTKGMKSFALFPIYGRDRTLAGLHLNAFDKSTAGIFDRAWSAADGADERFMSIGAHKFKITNLSIRTSPRYAELINQPPASGLMLFFHTATAFHVRQGDLLLPIPRNVFARPFHVWQAFAPPALALPDDWLSWCEGNVLVTRHRIRTVKAAINEQNWQTGFAGLVSFRAFDGEGEETELYRRVWQALGRFATYCGVGRKTTMGMGHCAYRRPKSKQKTKDGAL